MNLHTTNIDAVVQMLLDYSITPYKFIELIRNECSHLTPEVRKLVSTHPSPYIRLCAAWSLGEIGDAESFPILRKAYKEEKEDNVRTNIVWALFMIDSSQIDINLFQDFIGDPYFLIPIVAIKRLSGIPLLQGVIDFSQIYNKCDNILLKVEMLRNIRCFRFPTNINEILSTILRNSNDEQIKMGIIHAIGATNQIDSADILMQYYIDNTVDVLHNESLAYEYVSAMQSLGQSKSYKSLQEIYFNFQSEIMRWKIIESLAIAGGPECAATLKYIYDEETDSKLKEHIITCSNAIIITNK